MELKEYGTVKLSDGSFTIYRSYGDYYEISDTTSDDYILLKKEEIIELKKTLNELDF